MTRILFVGCMQEKKLADWMAELFELAAGQLEFLHTADMQTAADEIRQPLPDAIVWQVQERKTFSHSKATFAITTIRQAGFTGPIIGISDEFAEVQILAGAKWIVAPAKLVAELRKRLDLEPAAC